MEDKVEGFRYLPSVEFPLEIRSGIFYVFNTETGPLIIPTTVKIAEGGLSTRIPWVKILDIKVPTQYILLDDMTGT